MEGLETNIFGDKKFKDLLEEIYTNQKKKDKQISTLIGELKPMVNDIGDATLIVPLIREYLEMGVKNDELLIKMVTVAQRCIAGRNGVEAGSEFKISEEEKSQLLRDVNKLNDKTKE